MYMRRGKKKVGRLYTQSNIKPVPTRATVARARLMPSAPHTLLGEKKRKEIGTAHA